MNYELLQFAETNCVSRHCERSEATENNYELLQFAETNCVSRHCERSEATENNYELLIMNYYSLRKQIACPVIANAVKQSSINAPFFWIASLRSQ